MPEHPEFFYYIELLYNLTFKNNKKELTFMLELAMTFIIVWNL